MLVLMVVSPARLLIMYLSILVVLWVAFPTVSTAPPELPAACWHPPVPVLCCQLAGCSGAEEQPAAETRQLIVARCWYHPMIVLNLPAWRAADLYCCKSYRTARLPLASTTQAILLLYVEKGGVSQQSCVEPQASNALLKQCQPSSARTLLKKAAFCDDEVHFSESCSASYCRLWPTAP